MTDSPKWFVTITDEAGREHSRMGPFSSKRKAERVEDGANINLDHWNFQTNLEASWD